MDLIGKVKQYNTVRKNMIRKYQMGGSIYGYGGATYQTGGGVDPITEKALAVALMKQRGNFRDFDALGEMTPDQIKALANAAREQGLEPDNQAGRYMLNADLQKVVRNPNVIQNEEMRNQYMNQLQTLSQNPDATMGDFMKFRDDLKNQDYFKTLQNRGSQGGGAQSATEGAGVYSKTLGNTSVSRMQ